MVCSAPIRGYCRLTPIRGTEIYHNITRTATRKRAESRLPCVKGAGAIATEVLSQPLRAKSIDFAHLPAGCEANCYIGEAFYCSAFSLPPVELGVYFHVLKRQYFGSTNFSQRYPIQLWHAKSRALVCVGIGWIFRAWFTVSSILWFDYSNS